MTLDEFRKLTEEDKYVAWTVLAVEVAHFQNPSHVFCLYRLDNFYLELQVLKSNSSRLWLDAFDDINRLDPYLQQINLAALDSAGIPVMGK